MRTRGLPTDSPVACADPQYLPVIDASFKKGGAEAAALITRYLCAECPVRAACYDLGDGEAGPWGGFTRSARTKRGQTPQMVGNSMVNLRGIRHGIDRSERTSEGIRAARETAA